MSASTIVPLMYHSIHIQFNDAILAKEGNPRGTVQVRCRLYSIIVEVDCVNFNTQLKMSSCHFQNVERAHRRRTVIRETYERVEGEEGGKRRLNDELVTGAGE